VEGWAALIHPNDRTMMEEYFKNEVLGRRRTFDREYRILRHNDQVECWVHGQGKLEGDAEGTLLKMIGTIQDISWRKLAEEELQKKN
jgi:PAS domain S-box-containing protein